MEKQCKVQNEHGKAWKSTENVWKKHRKNIVKALKKHRKVKKSMEKAWKSNEKH